MKQIIAVDTLDLTRKAAAWIEARAQTSVRCFLPAGATCQPLYEHWRRDQPTYLTRLQPVQLDEVATGARSGIFEAFFRSELPALAPRFEWIKDCPPAAELAVLGFGRNGHLAFHEPELTEDFAFGCVRLSAPTVKNLGLEDRTWGLTFGVGAFAKCRELLLLISGDGKDAAWRAFQRGEKQVPASALRHHPGLTVIVNAATVAP